MFDDSGEDVLRVPGLPEVPLDYELPYGKRFAHGAREWCQLPGITARELAMTEAMNQITNKHDWHRYIDDQQKVSEWEAEARTQHELISDKAWEWCLSDLRDKANEYKKKRFVRVLDTGSCVCKSDELLGSTFAASLKTELDPLFTWHESSGSRSDLVDPYMFPLMFGRTRLLTRGCVKLAHSDAETENMLFSEAHTTLTESPINTRMDSDYVEALCQEITQSGYQLRHQSVPEAPLPSAARYQLANHKSTFTICRLFGCNTTLVVVPSYSLVHFDILKKCQTGITRLCWWISIHTGQPRTTGCRKGSRRDFLACSSMMQHCSQYRRGS